MPNQDDRLYIQFDVAHTIVNAVEQAQRLLCLLSGCQNDPMLLKLLKQPMMNRTSPDHELQWPDPAIVLSNRMNAAIVRFYLIICSLIWHDALALWCPNVNRVQFDMFGPRIRYNSLPSSPTNRKFGSHCEWDFRRLNIHLIRMRQHRSLGTCYRKMDKYCMWNVFKSLIVFALHSPNVTIILDCFELMEDSSFVIASDIDCFIRLIVSQTKFIIIWAAIASLSTNTELITVAQCCWNSINQFNLWKSLACVRMAKGAITWNRYGTRVCTIITASTASRFTIRSREISHICGSL